MDRRRLAIWLDGLLVICRDVTRDPGFYVSHFGTGFGLLRTIGPKLLARRLLSLALRRRRDRSPD
jgi:hypothetical protein